MKPGQLVRVIDDRAWGSMYLKNGEVYEVDSRIYDGKGCVYLVGIPEPIGTFRLKPITDPIDILLNEVCDSLTLNQR